MASLQERIAFLEESVASLAEIVGYGRAGHINSPDGNVALKIMQTLRPEAAATASAPEGPVTLCLKKRRPDQDEDGEVCSLPTGHEGGHAFAPPVKAPKEPVSA
jgi:hypothetical protein